MTDFYFTGTQTNIVAANTQININCGFPDEYTETWAIPQASYSDPTFWFILMPPSQGYMNGSGSWTQTQMINGVINVDIEEPQSNWWPPSPFPPK